VRDVRVSTDPIHWWTPSRVSTSLVALGSALAEANDGHAPNSHALEGCTARHPKFAMTEGDRY